MVKDNGIDKVFLFLVLLLTVIGFTVFLSASMGILAKDPAQFSSITFKQVFFGIFLGFIACYIFSKIDYKILKKYALLIFSLSLLSMLLVFIPHVGISLNGAKRWVYVFGISFQPVAILNIGFVIYWSAWLSFVKDKVSQIKYGLIPLLTILAVSGALLLMQPDTDSFIIICATGIAMLLMAGGRFRDVFLLGLLGILCIAVLAFTRPYVMKRIETFIDPSQGALTSSYQTQQSLIAVGSGQFFGRGLGQSIQKFKFLPESISDSIFAVMGEELGFVGCVFVILLFLFWVFRGFKISIRAPDSFSGLLVAGIVILITLQSFMNIASTLAIMPVSGVPLAFFSQGGTAMFLMLAQIGMIFNVSKHSKKN